MENGQGRGNARWVFLPLVSIMLLLCASQKQAAAVEHEVGGSPGWVIPGTANGVNYTTWASSENFSVGDTLHFNYSRGDHSVLEVTEDNYNSCTLTSPIASWDAGNTIVEVNETGTLYFVCGISGHCALGQKVAIVVHDNSTSSSAGAALPSARTLLYLSCLLALSFVWMPNLLP